MLKQLLTVDVENDDDESSESCELPTVIDKKWDSKDLNQE